MRAAKTNIMQAIIQDEMAVIPSQLGEMLVIVLKMLIRTRKRVTSIAIRAGITSGGIRKLTEKVKQSSITCKIFIFSIHTFLVFDVLNSNVGEMAFASCG
jgi:hypothetical protein